MIKSKCLRFYVPVAVYSKQQWGSLPVQVKMKWSLSFGRALSLWITKYPSSNRLHQKKGHFLLGSFKSRKAQDIGTRKGKVSVFPTVAVSHP